MQKMRRTFMLSDLEDRALAACDDQHLAVPTAQDILSSWFVRHISTGEMRDVYARLSELGLLKTYVRRGGVLVAAPLLGSRTRSLQVRATAKGRRYLSRKPRKVTG
jgi:hypothetical protein